MKSDTIATVVLLGNKWFMTAATWREKVKWFFFFFYESVSILVLNHFWQTCQKKYIYIFFFLNLKHTGLYKVLYVANAVLYLYFPMRPVVQSCVWYIVYLNSSLNLAKLHGRLKMNSISKDPCVLAEIRWEALWVLF